jgi:hypothetical protein
MVSNVYLLVQLELMLLLVLLLLQMIFVDITILQRWSKKQPK